MVAIVFDIETGPLPLDDLKKIVDPYEADASLVRLAGAEFDPASVKYGNTKDEAKRAEKLAAARDKFAEEKAAAEAKLKTGEVDYWSEVQEHAALDATTGRVVAIGYRGPKRRFIEGLGEDIGTTQPATELDLLVSFWDAYRRCKKSGVRLIGHNIFGFDLPFLIQRSWIVGVAVPEAVIRDDRYFDPIFADTMKVWRCNQWGSEGVTRRGLDRISKAMGMVGKTGDGREFWHLWTVDRPRAKAYLETDLELTWAVAQKLGVIT